MNPKIENLRVAVVPTETDNGIDQSSTVEEILACEETVLYSVTDYFKAQNDEAIDLLHWSFLIDISDKTDWTGCNIDGIHTGKIAYIKGVISKWGSTTTAEVKCSNSPCILSIDDTLYALVERFKDDGVTVISYYNGMNIHETDLGYDDLSDEIIDDIYWIIQDYEADMLKTEKRCQD